MQADNEEPMMPATVEMTPYILKIELYRAEDLPARARRAEHSPPRLLPLACRAQNDTTAFSLESSQSQHHVSGVKTPFNTPVPFNSIAK